MNAKAANNKYEPNKEADIKEQDQSDPLSH